MIAGRKAFEGIRPVFMATPNEIVGYANVQGAMFATGH